MARCIVGLADSARYADNRLAAACFAAALDVAAGSVAWPVVAVPIRYSARLLDSSRLPSAGFPLLGYGMFARCARVIQA